MYDLIFFLNLNIMSGQLIEYTTNDLINKKIINKKFD
jgi:hypothetical protein